MEIFSASYLMPVSTPPIAGGAMAVAEGRVVAVDTLANLKRQFSAPVREFPGRAIIPGLVNAHTHLELTHFPSWKIRKGIDYSPRTYVDWIVQVIKIRRALAEQELALSVREGLRISLEAGTTTIGEILTHFPLLGLYATAPIGGRIYFELIGHDPNRGASLLASVDETLKSFPCGRFSAGLSPHAPHTVSEIFLREISAFAAGRSLPLALHLSESAEEEQFIFHSSGPIADLLYPFVHWEGYLRAPRRESSTALVANAGVLAPSTMAVHAVHVTPADAEILRRQKTTVTICPRSNEKLAVGTAPYHLFQKAGIPLALGTDSLASNDSLSLFDEMRFLLEHHSDTFSPEQLLQMATAGGAAALSLPDLGTLDQDKQADFLVVKAISLDPPRLCRSIIEQGELQEVFIGGQSAICNC